MCSIWFHLLCYSLLCKIMPLNTWGLSANPFFFPPDPNSCSHLVLLTETMAAFFFFWTWLLFLLLLFNYWSHMYKGAHWTWQGVRTSEEKKEWVEINLLTITVLKCACFCICVSAVVQRMHFEWRNMSCLCCMYLTGWGNQDHGFEATRNKRRSRRLHTFHLQHFLIRYFFFHSCSKENLHSWQLNFKSFTFKLRSETMHWLKLVYI